jgi:hypothetical protein
MMDSTGSDHDLSVNAKIKITAAYEVDFLTGLKYIDWANRYGIRAGGVIVRSKSVFGFRLVSRSSSRPLRCNNHPR